MAFDWTRNRPNGLDLASEGIVVVTVQSRTNVFGWLSLETSDAPGNLGLYDQNLALKWIQGILSYNIRMIERLTSQFIKKIFKNLAVMQNRSHCWVMVHLESQTL